MASSLVRGKYIICEVLSAEDSKIIEDGAIYQIDGNIIEIGDYADLRSKYSPDEVIGSSKFMVIPGLINAHHHNGITPFQLGTLDHPLETLILSRMGKRQPNLYLDTKYCAMQMIESGITTVMHNQNLLRLPSDIAMYESSTKVVQAYEESGMRVAFSLSFKDQNTLLYEDDEAFLATLPLDLNRDVRAFQEERPISMEQYLAM